MINTYIPYLKGKEKKLVNECIKKNFVSSSGDLIPIFEKKFCKIYNFKHASALNSGTSALHLGLKSIGVTKSDVVIVPSYTFAATANAIIYNNAEPWFFDSNKNFEFSLTALEKELKIKTYFSGKLLKLKSNNKIVRALIPVSTFGKKLNFNSYYKFALKYNLKLLFDTAACHDPAIFKFKKKPNMNFCFSFNGNKTITTGAGGVFASNSKSIIKKVKIDANVGKKFGKYDYFTSGFNYKMTNIQAAFGLAQLDMILDILRKKRKLFTTYYNFFKSSNYKFIHDKKFVNWVFVLITKSVKEYKLIKKKFDKSKIQMSYFWKPLHLQKPYKKYLKTKMLYSNNIWNRVILLPSHPGVGVKDQKKILNELKKLKVK
tara:strand:- start:3723 stop:4844 length:1122 start_codon:yes stop_codon:yes gene_type:complete